MSYRPGGWVVRKAKRGPSGAAEPEFDVLITVDTNLRYQQNMEGRSLAIVVLYSPSNRLEHLRKHFPVCCLALEKIKPGQIVRVGTIV